MDRLFMFVCDEVTPSPLCLLTLLTDDLGIYIFLADSYADLKIYFVVMLSTLKCLFLYLTGSFCIVPCECLAMVLVRSLV